MSSLWYPARAQRPDLLMATNPLLVALLTFLFNLPLSG